MTKTVTSDLGRDFLLQILHFSNGLFIIISEGEPRIGAVSISISSANKVNSAKVIPSKYDAVFVNTVTEKVSLLTNGKCLVSLYSKVRLELEDMKAIMGEIMEIVGDKAADEKRKRE